MQAIVGGYADNRESVCIIELLYIVIYSLCVQSSGKVKTFDDRRNCFLGNNFELAAYWKEKEEGEN